MPRLTLDQVKQEIAELGFSFKTGNYTNLRSILVVSCAENHEITTTLHDLRKKRPCPFCAEIEKIAEHEEMLEQLPKKEGKRVLAIDNATKITGYAVFEDGKLLAHGVKKVSDEEDVNLRISYMKQWFVSMVRVWDIDVVGFENVQYQNNPQTLIILSKLLGVLENAALDFSLDTYTVASVTWKSHCGIKGATRERQKANARNYVKTNYNIKASEDAADAICLGTYVSYKERFGKKVSW